MASVLAALSACSLAVDLDGLTGGSTVDAGADVGPAIDGAPADGADDSRADARIPGDGSSSLDGRAPPDGGTLDAANDTSGPLDPCAPAPNLFFCDAFGASSLGATWDHDTLTQGSLDPAVLVSPPSSLYVDLAAGSADVADYLSKALTPPAATALDIAFDLRVDQPGPVYPVGIFCGPSDYSLSLNLDSSGIAEQGGGVAYVEHATTATFPTAVWRHVEIVLRRAEATVEVHVDGAVVLPPTNLVGTSNVVQGGCTLVLGMFYAPKQTAWRAHFDDVRITTL